MAIIIAQKSPVSYTILTLKRVSYATKKKKDLTESIGVVPAEYPPKVKLELFSQP